MTTPFPGPSDEEQPGVQEEQFTPPPPPSSQKKPLGKAKIVLMAVGSAFVGGLAVLGVTLALVAPSSTGPRHRVAAPTNSSSHDTSPTPGQQFIADMNNDPTVTVTASNSALLGLGHSICQVVAAGAQPTTIESMLRSKTGAASAKEIVRLAEKDLCPNAVASAPRVVATFSGSGIENTAPFSIGGSGNWVLHWTYDCSSFGMNGNFIVSEDNGNDLNGASVNELGPHGHGTTYVYGDAGVHHLSVDSECNWTAEVVTTS